MVQGGNDRPRSNEHQPHWEGQARGGCRYTDIRTVIVSLNVNDYATVNYPDHKKVIASANETMRWEGRMDMGGRSTDEQAGGRGRRRRSLWLTVV